MAACGSLRPLFENPLPENPTLIESLSSWSHHKPMKPIEVSSFAEMFGELYFHEKPQPPATISTVALDQDPRPNIQAPEKPLNSPFGLPKKFSAKKSESLQMCTEGLGSESSDDVDDLLESGDDWRTCGRGKTESNGRQLMYNRFDGYTGCWLDVKPAKNRREFPPPIPSIGRSGKPWMCLKSYREDGRFVLREIRIPNQELLHASREDGRLKLHFVHPDEDIAECEEENDDGEREEEGAEIIEDDGVENVN